MKSSLINLLQGYFSVFKYIFTGRNDGKFLQLNYGLSFVLLVLVIIGFARNFLAVILGVRVAYHELVAPFYLMRPDIVFTMMVGPLYFCFFGALALGLLLRLFKAQRRDKEILGLCFHLQIIHLLVPFLEVINMRFNIPPYIPVFPAESLQFLVAPVAFMTIGIIAAWLLSGVAVIRFLKDVFCIRPFKIFLIAFITFNLFLWPVYMVFGFFANYVFNYLFLAERVEEIDDFMGGFVMGSYDIFYGYAIFFLLLAIPGIVYFRKLFLKKTITT